MVDWGEEKPNGEFWVNFRQEDGICRMGTGRRKNGGFSMLDFEWWIVD
jgi:hypothetical protein